MVKTHNIEEEVILRKLSSYEIKQKDERKESLINFDLYGQDTIMDINRVSKNISDLTQLIDILKETSENYAFRPLISEQKLIGPVIIFFKRTVRKLLKWYIEPICFQQTVFNNAVTRSIKKIAEIQKELVVSVAELTKQTSLANQEPLNEERKPDSSGN